MVLYLFPNRYRQDFAPALETNDKRSASSSERRPTTNGAAVLVVDYTLYKRIFW
jgi:spore coat protein U-like protein